MKPNDIEFLMHAMNCLNSPNKEVVEAFRTNKHNINRLAELVSIDKAEFLNVLDKLKGIIK